VDHSVSGEGPRWAAPAEELAHPQAVQRVAEAEEQRAHRPRDEVSASSHHPGQRELGGAGKRQQAEHARLGNREARGGCRGAESEAGEADSEPDPEPVADGGSARQREKAGQRGWTIHAREPSRPAAEDRNLTWLSPRRARPR